MSVCFLWIDMDSKIYMDIGGSGFEIRGGIVFIFLFEVIFYFKYYKWRLIF